MSDWLNEDDPRWDDVPTTGAPRHPDLDGGLAGWAADHQRLLIILFWTLVAAFGAVIALLIGR